MVKLLRIVSPSVFLLSSTRHRNSARPIAVYKILKRVSEKIDRKFATHRAPESSESFTIIHVRALQPKKQRVTDPPVDEQTDDRQGLVPAHSQNRDKRILLSTLEWESKNKRFELKRWLQRPIIFSQLSSCY